jgi:glycine cleavage system H protein
VNTELAEAPERLNEDPYGAGWLCLLQPSDASAVEALLDAGSYSTLTADAEAAE